MEIHSNRNIYSLPERATVNTRSLEKKSELNLDRKEKIARVALVEVWTRLLEEYSRPGVQIPPMDVVRKILENNGVYAATEAINKKYWYISRSKIEKEVRKNVKKSLKSSELDAFMDEVKRAQKDSSLLPFLKSHIRDYIMNGF